MGLHISSNLDAERCFCNVICMDVHMCPLLATERLDGFYSYSVFRSFSVTGQSSVNINILAPKIGVLHRDPRI
jgi:hypothetical protein